MFDDTGVTAECQCQTSPHSAAPTQIDTKKAVLCEEDNENLAQVEQEDHG
jgi:hypothetical protein